MALALVLVIGAALLIRTFLKMQAVDPGFDLDNVLTMAMSMSGDRFQKTAPVAQMIRDGTGAADGGAGGGGCGRGQRPADVPQLWHDFDVVGRPKTNSPFTGGSRFLLDVVELFRNV